jgi:4-amino-4-deoxy-L-arabinose transferase-like glycosyltransferase
MEESEKTSEVCQSTVVLMFQNKAHFAYFLIISLIAAGAVWVLLYSTPEGLTLSDDSIAYIAGARSILAGNGYREAWLASNGPVTHFPPGFSSALVIVGLSGLDPLRGARFINALLFGVNAFLLGLIGWRMTKSQIAGIVLALLFAVNASMLRLHVAAMSEPLYIFFSLVAFLTFSNYFRVQGPCGTQIPKGYDVNADLADLKSENLRSQRLSASRKNSANVWLVLTGILTAFAYLTRYAGLALLATFIVALIFLHDTWRKRLTSAGIFTLSFLPWALGWSIRNRLVADNATNRQLVFHPLTAENIETGLYNLSEFLIPVESWRRVLFNTPNFIVVVLSIIGLSILVWLLYKGLKKFLQPASERPEVLSFTNGLYLFGYLASIISSMMLFDASTKFKLRILSPIYISLLVLLVFLGYWLWGRRALLWRGLVAVFALVFLALSAAETLDAVSLLHRGGQGYASFRWYDSEAMAFLRDLPEGTRIYTNQSGPVYLYTNRPNYVLPDLVDPVTGLPRGNYEQGVASLQQDVLSGNAVLALFKFGSEEEDVQTVYLQLADGLYLAHQSRGDKIYTAHP